jgi:hypothetical protein
MGSTLYTIFVLLFIQQKLMQQRIEFKYFFSYSKRIEKIIKNKKSV